MRSPSRSQTGLAVTGALALAMAVPTIAQASGETSRHVVGSAPSWTAHAQRVAPVASSATQHLTFVLNLRDAAGAQALADAVSTPGSAQYGHFVSAASWRSRFAPTSSQVASVTSWLRGHGFTIGSVPANHRYIEATAPAATAQKALATKLSSFRKAGQTVTAPTTAYSVPASLAGLVAGVAGLDTSARKTPMRAVPDTTAQQQKAAAHAASGSTRPAEVLPPPDAVFRNARPCSSYYGEKMATTLPQLVKNPQPYAPCGYKPPQVRGAYGTNVAQSQGYDGRGTTVAVVDAYASQYILGDATRYAQLNDPSHPLRSYQLDQNLPANFTHTDECGASGWYGEETLDVEAVHATAPGAKILYVGAESCFDDDINAAVNTVVDNELAQVITNSYGETDDVVAPADLVNSHQTALQAAAEGISMVFSSGDDGDEIAASGQRQTDFQASDPMVTAVGGTALAVTQGNGYGFEQGWGTGKSSLVNGAWSPSKPAYLYGGGGGTTHLFAEPSYQKPVVPAALANYFREGPHRVVPDVAMVGDPNTGFLVGQSQTFPDGSIKYSEYRIGGTSLSSPLFAGMVAVADQVNRGSLGFLNPKLYSLSGTSAFRDVNHGRSVTDAVVRVDYANGFDSSDGLLTSLRTLNQTGTIYTRKGYDDVTGVGSPNGISFLMSMALKR